MKPLHNCTCNQQTEEITAKFRVTWQVEFPNYRSEEPQGWELEFTDTPEKIAYTCQQLVQWLNTPPICSASEMPSNAYSCSCADCSHNSYCNCQHSYQQHTENKNAYPCPYEFMRASEEERSERASEIDDRDIRNAAKDWLKKTLKKQDMEEAPADPQDGTFIREPQNFDTAKSSSRFMEEAVINTENSRYAGEPSRNLDESRFLGEPGKLDPRYMEQCPGNVDARYTRETSRNTEKQYNDKSSRKLEGSRYMRETPEYVEESSRNLAVTTCIHEPSRCMGEPPPCTMDQSRCMNEPHTKRNCQSMSPVQCMPVCAEVLTLQPENSQGNQNTVPGDGANTMKNSADSSDPKLEVRKKPTRVNLKASISARIKKSSNKSAVLQKSNDSKKLKSKKSTEQTNEQITSNSSLLEAKKLPSRHKRSKKKSSRAREDTGKDTDSEEAFQSVEKIKSVRRRRSRLRYRKKGYY